MNGRCVAKADLGHFFFYGIWRQKADISVSYTAPRPRHSGEGRNLEATALATMDAGVSSVYLLDQINDPDAFEFISALRIEVIGPERIKK